jgi:hypothetical protein
MQTDRSRAPRERVWRARHSPSKTGVNALMAGRLAVSLALAGMASSCGSVGQGITDMAGGLASMVAADSSAPAAAARGTRIAFGRIEGAPADVTARLSADLTAEAAARQIVVVPTDQASYRLRGYLALRPDRGTTSVSWAWDVYDASLHRAFRLGGQESGRVAAEGDPWATADDAMLRRIAQAGMLQLVDFISRRPEPVPSEPDDAPPLRPGTVAAFDESH